MITTKVINDAVVPFFSSVDSAAVVVVVVVFVVPVVADY